MRVVIKGLQKAWFRQPLGKVPLPKLSRLNSRGKAFGPGLLKELWGSRFAK